MEGDPEFEQWGRREVYQQCILVRAVGSWPLNSVEFAYGLLGVYRDPITVSQGSMERFYFAIDTPHNAVQAVVSRRKHRETDIAVIQSRS